MQLQVGDKVWLDRRNIETIRPMKKLDHKKLGPFEVLEQVNPVSYRLKLPLSMTRLHDVFHISLLTPVRENLFEGRIIPPPPPIVVEGIEELEVQEVLDSRIHCKRLQYLVRWTGQDFSEDSWEAAGN